MDFQVLLESYGPKIKSYWLPISLSLLGLIFFVYGLMSSFSPHGSSGDVVFEEQKTSSGAARPETKQIAIDIEGAVMHSGVYATSSGVRLREVLELAGGFSQDADKAYIEKHVNLASVVLDGAKIYIPRIGEEKIAEGVSSQTGGSFSEEKRININTASETELDTLPGIGLTLARKITQSRPYSQADELIAKKVLSSKVFEKIKDRIVAY